MENPEKVEPSDRELIEKYGDGDPGALGTLVVKYRRQLYGFIVHLTGGADDADEIFQEVWFRVIRHIDSYEDQNFAGWLFRICRNLVIDRARNRKRVVSLEDTAGHHTDEGWESRVPAAGASPSEAASDQELGRRIRVAVRALPEEQREVFLLRIEAYMPFKEIARVQGVSINTALARMQYALARLQGLLKADYQALGGPMK